VDFGKNILNMQGSFGSGRPSRGGYDRGVTGRGGGRGGFGRGGFSGDAGGSPGGDDDIQEHNLSSRREAYLSGIMTEQDFLDLSRHADGTDQLARVTLRRVIAQGLAIPLADGRIDLRPWFDKLRRERAQIERRARGGGAGISRLRGRY